MRLPDTTASVQDLTRWNRAGLGRFRYIDGAAAEWLEYLRVCHLLLYARSDKIGNDPLPQEPEVWVEAYRSGKMPDGKSVAVAASALKSMWDRADFDGAPPPDASYAQILRAQYDHIGLDQTRHVSRAVARAFHILTESLNAYANECFIDTATQPEHLRMLLEMIGFRPRPAASARVPVALIVTPEAVDRTLDPGLGFDFNPNDGGPLLAFESLDAIKVHPALNMLRPLGWNQASDPIATGTNRFVVGDAGVLNNAIGGSYALLGSPGAYEAVRVDAVDKAEGAVTVHRYAANAQATYQQAGFRLMPSARVTVRPTGSGWVHFSAPPQAHVGQPLSLDIDMSGIVLWIIDPTWDGLFRVAELRGPDLRLSPASLNRVEAVYPVKTTYTKSNTETDPSGNPLLIAGAQVRAEELGPIGQIESLEGSRCYVLGDIPQGLVAGEPAVFVTKTGSVTVGSVGSIRNETAGFSFVPSSGIAPSSVAEVHAGFGITAPLAHETRSRSAVFEGDGKLHVRAGGGAALLLPGKTLLIAADPDSGVSTPTVATEVTAVERAGDVTKLSLGILEADLSGLLRGDTVVYANVVSFGHGKTAPAKTIGSGDNSQPAQSFAIADGPLATRPDPNFPGGAALDIEIKVDGRTWRQAAELFRDSELSYAVTLDEKGQHIVSFGQRLPSGTDNVVLAKSRTGAGSRGNLLTANKVFALKPKNPAVSAIVQPLGAQFGADVQDATALKAQGGGHFALADRALSVSDFAKLAESHSGVWHAHAALERVIGPSVNTSIALTVVPAGEGGIEPIREDLEAFMMKRVAPGVVVSIQPFLAAPFGGTATLTLRQGYARSQTVIDEIGAVLKKRFGLEARALGRTLYVTEIVSAIESHEAVENSVFTLTPQWASADAPRVVTSAAGAIQAVVPHATQSVYLPSNGIIQLAFGSGG